MRYVKIQSVVQRFLWVLHGDRLEWSRVPTCSCCIRALFLICLCRFHQQDGEGGRERDWDRQRGESERRFVGGREKEIGTDREERVREDLFGRN